MGSELDKGLERVRETFIQESQELLEAMEGALLCLEKDPGDAGTINALFRYAHTIKGSSGVLGAESVEKFTHVVENLLTRVRDNDIPLTAAIIGVMLECRDHIARLVDLFAEGKDDLPEGLAAQDELLLKKLNAFLPQAGISDNSECKNDESISEECRLSENGAWHISVRFGRDVFRNGMDPASFINYLSKIGEIIGLAAIHDSMPPFEEMDPESCYLGFEISLRTDADKKTIEDAFEFVREDCALTILPPNSAVESYIELIRNMPDEAGKLGEILVKSGALTDRELKKALSAQSGTGGEKLGDLLVEKGTVEPRVVEAALDKQEKTRSKDARTIRIDADKLDTLINLVGELVSTSASMEEHARRLKDGWLTESSSVMTRLVEEIREGAMRIRMVPIGETFSRFQRVVRDTSRSLGKEIELLITGGETELDKTVVEKINDPLMHLIRNAVDHGIEAPEERAGAGKKAKGAIRLNAFHDAGGIVIEICDDGRGLDRKKIVDKATRLGLVAPGHDLSESEVLGLIFEPGFSTAEEVTKLSGRGVGMDVVKKNIEQLRGTVTVESAEGIGTTVRIRLPLTLAIIDGFMVGINGSNYIIPLDMVVECVELKEEDRKMADKRSYVNLRGGILPYVRLRDFFNDHGNPARFENIVVVDLGGRKTGLVVDELHGEVQTVIKPLGKIYSRVRGVSGATIMGTGKVALILDVAYLVQSIEQGALTA
jgi:two-component system, chemotaxis family, sensor kinase CheA